jgi:hypothetical protein
MLLVLTALFAGVAIGFYLAVVAVSTMFEHPSSLEQSRGGDFRANGLEPNRHSRFLGRWWRRHRWCGRSARCPAVARRGASPQVSSRRERGWPAVSGLAPAALQLTAYRIETP